MKLWRIFPDRALLDDLLGERERILFLFTAPERIIFITRRALSFARNFLYHAKPSTRLVNIHDPPSSVCRSMKITASQVAMELLLPRPVAHIRNPIDCLIMKCECPIVVFRDSRCVEPELIWYSSERELSRWLLLKFNSIIREESKKIELQLFFVDFRPTIQIASVEREENFN